MPLHDALDLKAAEIEAMTDSFEEVRHAAAIKQNLDAQFLFMDKPFGYREYFIALVLLWFLVV